MNDEIKITELPFLILRGRVLMPNVNASFEVSKIKSMSSVSKAIDYGNLLFVTAQKAGVEDSRECYTFGVVVRIKKISQQVGANLRVYVETLYRAELKSIDESGEVALAKIIEQPSKSVNELEEQYYVEHIKSQIRDYQKFDVKILAEVFELIYSYDDPDEFVNVTAHNLPLKESDKQALLEETVILERCRILSLAIGRLCNFAAWEKQLANDVKESVDKGQKEYYLREQLKAIHKELGDSEEETDQLEDAIRGKKMPEEIEEKALKELSRMKRMSPSSPDWTVLRTYLDNLLEVPFNEKTPDDKPFKKIIKILDSEHFGLDKVKERIIEYIAVLKNTKKVSGSILCLAGPPGVGKTSVATSVAKALGRKFVRMSLGGVKDEAEIRGHRKTYIGAMPGRIITGLKEAKVTNPVFLLDEIDKLSSDLRGDPASALLEVLDPEQNKTFRDRYMEIAYDLSDVLFITTANNLDTIPAPLLDRMEVIQLEGYTKEDKLQIAKRYIIKKKLKSNGLTDEDVAIRDDAIRLIVSGYTKEAGVRNLERLIDAVIRKVVRAKMEKGEDFKKTVITAKNVKDYLGVQKYFDDEVAAHDEVGSVNGLAWTSVGGTTLNIEVAVMKGKGNVVLTGKLGDVMKESAQTAFDYLRSNAARYGIEEKIFTECDVHLHAPEGAVPKDGPSAGITIATAMLSAIKNKKVRHDVAMTGEITLLGKVLAIGGLKEKSLAAYRTGIKNIIIPKANVKDLEEIDENIRKDINFIPVTNVTEVFDNAFAGGGYAD